jgi:hypothetical protein
MNITEQDMHQSAMDGHDPASQAAVEFEGEVRELLQRDLPFSQRPATGAGDDAVSQSVSSLLQRVSTASTDEIERVIVELQVMRDSMRTKADQVQRDITNYAAKNQSTMSSMRVIVDCLQQWSGPISQIDRTTLSEENGRIG